MRDRIIGDTMQMGRAARPLSIAEIEAVKRAVDLVTHCRTNDITRSQLAFAASSVVGSTPHWIELTTGLTAIADAFHQGALTTTIVDCEACFQAHCHERT